MDTVITVATVLLGVAGLVLVGDIATIWRGDREPLRGPDRAQLLTGAAIVIFSVSFFLARAVGDEEQAPTALVAEPVVSSAAGARRSATRLASDARLPGLVAEPGRQPRREPERPARKPERGGDEAPAESPTPPTTTTTTPTTTTTAPTTTTTPTAPEPPPPPDEVPFDSRE